MIAFFIHHKWTQEDIEYFIAIGYEVQMWIDDNDNQEFRIIHKDGLRDAVQGYLTEEEYASIPENLDYIIFWR